MRDPDERSTDRVRDALGYLQRLVDHEISSVGISAGSIEGLSLDAVTAVSQALGDPHRSFRVVHVTGTNGKGTVCRLVEALVGACGLRVGCYMSPEGSVNERIRVDGRPIDDVALADAISTVRGTAEHLGVTLSAFEAVTLAALLVFSDAPVDVAVIEVGLLGRFDATNVVEADVAVITNIGSDHTDFSPDWKAKIASEKAGIIDRRSHVVLGDIADELVDIIASEPHATLARYGRDFDCEENHLAVGGRRVATVQSSGSRIDATVPLHGRHQGENFAVAVEAAEAVLATQLSSEVVNEAMTTMPPLTGRVEMLAIDPVVIADGAHNPEAAAALGTTLAETFMVPGRRTALVSMLAGRDPQTFLTALHRAYPLDLVVACELADPRAAPAAEIAAAADAVGIACVQSPSIEAGMQRAFQQGDADDLIVVTGSFRVVAPARAASRQRNQ